MLRMRRAAKTHLHALLVMRIHCLPSTKKQASAQRGFQHVAQQPHHPGQRQYTQQPGSLMVARCNQAGELCVCVCVCRHCNTGMLWRGLS